ncbi:MAG: 6-hydroxymethylpterin diphosphokinase MptE-like protein, partial [Methanobacteriota archaeon]
MDFLEWEPYYERILEDFGFSRPEDEEVARELDRLLGGTRVPDRALRDVLEGSDVTVVGNGPNVEREIDSARGLVITADEATSAALARGRLPTILVTDLDGDVVDQVKANAQGTIAVVHAHGDNGPAVRTWASRFTGRTVATTQAAPSGGLR